MLKQILRSTKSHNITAVLSSTPKKTIAICNAINQNQKTAVEPVTASTKKQWDLYSAVCLERHPVIIKPMQEIELKFYNLLKKHEFENSLKCNHELKIEKEQKQDKIGNSDPDAVVVQTVQDFEDNCQEELNNFKFAPTITEFDKQNVTSSLERKLDTNLLLLVHQKVGNTYYWIPPQGIRTEGETMRQTAERVLLDICGTKVKAKFYGNAPIGFYKYKYPKSFSEKGSYGAKIFYFLAKYVEGNIIDDVKYQWLDHEELEKILPTEIQKSISQFMLNV